MKRMILMCALLAVTLAPVASRATTVQIASGTIQNYGSALPEWVAYSGQGCKANQPSGQMAAFINISAYSGKSLQLTALGPTTALESVAFGETHPQSHLIAYGHAACAPQDQNINTGDPAFTGSPHVFTASGKYLEIELSSAAPVHQGEHYTLSCLTC